VSAWELVNLSSAEELADIFFRYGEEKYARGIAASIAKRRAAAPIETTAELADLVAGSVPAAARRDGHPARKVFQALRIAVNGELDELSAGLRKAIALLTPGGRAAVISFHSLEDRIVKQVFAEYAAGCTCPRDFPVCVCGAKPTLKPVNRKPIEANAEEQDRNRRSRSAKLRVAEKL